MTAARTRTLDSDTATTGRMVAFILARIDDEEAAARRTIRSAGDTRGSTNASAAADRVVSARRTRLECEAKRAIIGHVQQLLALRDLPHEQPVRTAAREILHAMVGPYADHVGCRPEWIK